MSEIVYGLRAALSVFASRPADIERVAWVPPAPEVKPIARWARNNGVECREVRETELGKLAQSHNHEGVCLMTKPRKFVAQGDLAEILVRRKGAAVALDRVRNPYNVGAIVRTAAFFGIDAVILGAPAPHPALAPDAVRVAEGGAEHVALARTTDLADTLERLHKRGVSVVGADSHATLEARGFRHQRPVVVVVGHEREGLAPRIREQCDTLVALRGADNVESLNVAVATGILLAGL